MLTVESMPNVDTTSYKTPKELADAMRVGVPTVRRWIKQGRLPATRPGRQYLIAEADFTFFLAMASVPTPDEQADLGGTEDLP